MLACHAGGPGSIPGRCKSIYAAKRIFIHYSYPICISRDTYLLEGEVLEVITCTDSIELNRAVIIFCNHIRESLSLLEIFQMYLKSNSRIRQIETDLRIEY